VPLPTELIDLANAWIAGDWPERRKILTDQDQPVDAVTLSALATVYCDRPGLRQWLDLRCAIDADGEDAVLPALDTGHATINLVREWITTSSWNASQAFLHAHAELRRPDVHAALERLGDDEVARQHLAVLRLGERVPAGAVFDAIIDPGDARELLLTIARRGNAQDIAEVWFAAPPIATDSLTGPLAVALFLALSDDVDTHLNEIDQATGAAAAAASTRDRRDVLTLVAALSRTRDDRAGVIDRISSAFTGRTAG
jgi:hypothetical protein